MLNEFRLALRTLLKAPYFHSVAERTQETGIGMALGAERRDVLELFLRLRLLCCVGIWPDRWHRCCLPRTFPLAGALRLDPH
jgi:hypothetical protein